jgi:hypothetical protein
MNKICNKCNIIKPLIEFNKNKSKIDGYHVWCKKCISDNNKKLYVKDNERIKQQTNNYYNNNKNTISSKLKNYRNKPEIKVKQAEYIKEWTNKNKNHHKQYQKEYKKQYYRNNPHISICLNIKRRCLNGINDDRVTYTSNDLKNHIESLFESWMNWNNIGAWELHHNVPVSWFESNTPPFIINDLKNLYPLSKKENRNIKNRYIKFSIDNEYIKIIQPWIKKCHQSMI